MSLLGCSYALANDDGLSGNVGLCSSCVQISMAFRTSYFAYSIETEECKSNMYFMLLLKVCGTGTVLGVYSPCLCFGKTIRIRSLPDFVMAWALPKFPLKCIVAIINLWIDR